MMIKKNNLHLNRGNDYSTVLQNPSECCQQPFFLKHYCIAFVRGHRETGNNVCRCSCIIPPKKPPRPIIVPSSSRTIKDPGGSYNNEQWYNVNNELRKIKRQPKLEAHLNGSYTNDVNYRMVREAIGCHLYAGFMDIKSHHERKLFKDVLCNQRYRTEKEKKCTDSVEAFT